MDCYVLTQGMHHSRGESTLCHLQQDEPDSPNVGIKGQTQKHMFYLYEIPKQKKLFYCLEVRIVVIWWWELSIGM